MQLNLGCGDALEGGYVNVDICGDPDMRVDLEQCPWPWDDDSVGKIRGVYVLEHLGESRDQFLQIMKEMYRVCAHDARIHLIMTNPRSTQFSLDPTRVRPLVPESFLYFNKEQNKRWREKGEPHTRLGEILDVDFLIDRNVMVLQEPWHSKVASGELSHEECARLIRINSDLVTSYIVDLKVRKKKES